MNKKKFNILITINSGYAKYAVVMLTSLFENNQECFHIYCLYSELDESNRRLLAETVEKYNNKIHFIRVEKSVYQDFPTTQNLSIECYFILLAHKLLPQNMERILYLDSDMIIEGKIKELYNMDFGNQYMVVCGQSYRLIEGNYYGIGARPELGQCFNSGVILFNLPKFREHINEQTYLEAAQKADYHFELADQGILNIVFSDRVKYVDTLKYNFRISIYEDYIKDGNPRLANLPVIIHYVMRDYYRISYSGKPWKLTLNKAECRLLIFLGIINERFEYREADEMNFWMQRQWWYYARKTCLYYMLRKEMECEKKNVFRKLLLNGDMTQIAKRFYGWQNKISIFRKITIERFEGIEEKIKDLQYGDLEKYIDSLDIDSAVVTMHNLFKWNCNNLKKQEVIKIAFIVYSSSEWECEELYRLCERDRRFYPVIVVCAYLHGTEEGVRNTYIKTCQYFRKSGRQYNMEYVGYCNRKIKNKILDDYHILVYISPSDRMSPLEINMSQRNITQLCVHIPYGFYMVNKKDVSYGSSYYDMIIFKLCWLYFCPNAINADMLRKTQRLRGYNVQESGFPKMDSLINGTFLLRENLWKNEMNAEVKIIWAPHFNLKKGMNGTFYENYVWFYEFAREHQEISWIVRPHPRMEWGVLEYGVFKSATEYKAYLDAWNSLPNASVVEDGDYYDIFATSDAMILDSVSFLAEYQFTGKPLLLLKPENPRSMDTFGKMLIDILYTTRGNDFAQIQTFIENVKRKDDPMKEERKKFKHKYLELRSGKTATEFIYEVLTKNIYQTY